MSAIWEFNKALKKVEDNIKKIPQVIKPYVVKSVQGNIDNIKEPTLSPITIKNKGSALPLRDTGVLRSSITAYTDNLKVIAGTNLKYAPIQHFGGEIKPKRAKKLVIPANKQIRKQTMIYGVRGVLENYKKSGYRVVFLDNVIMAVPKNKKFRKYYKILYIRKDKVEIPARPFMYLKPEQEEKLTNIALDILKEGILWWNI